MASSKEDRTAEVTEQLGPMSLGESAESKKNETKPTAENGTTPTLCSACGKKSDTLMKCRACKCVWYCDKDCQNKHWKEHKKECKPIKKELDKRGGKLDVGTEVDIGPLGKVPPRDECPICMQVLPIHAKLQTYYACCGKTLCAGCDFQHQLKNSEERTCAFCRTAVTESDEEILARQRKRIELKDPDALLSTALGHGLGMLGLPVDETKCVELLNESVALGFPGAHYQLGAFHATGAMGFQRNKEEADRCFEKAADGGHLTSRHNLGYSEYENGDPAAAMRHWRLSASGGLRGSMKPLISSFQNGWLHHRDLAETLQAMYCARSEMKSESRNEWIKHLKETGQYTDQGVLDLYT